jgi:hypothetical protein
MEGTPGSGHCGKLQFSRGKQTNPAEFVEVFFRAFFGDFQALENI